MKKITLALSAVMLSASAAMALDFGETYVLVPADAATRATGKYLTAGEGGTLTYSNTLSTAALWLYDGEQDENYEFHQYLCNEGRYLTFADGVKATLTDDPAEAFPQMSPFVDNAHYVTNYDPFAYSPPTDRAYLNVATLTGEPENSASCAFYFVEASRKSTNAEIDAALFPMLYPNAKIIAVSSSSARYYGKYMSVDESGKVTTSNTLDLKAAWNLTQDMEGNYNIQNLSTMGYLYNSDLTLSATPVPLQLGESEAVKGAFGITSDLEAQAAGSSPNTPGPWLNALNTKAGIGTWSLDAGSSFFLIDYTPELTTEDVDDKVDMLLASPAVYNRAEAILNSSTIGKENKWEYLYAINSAENLEELNMAAQEAISAGVGFAEQQLNSDFGLYVNSLKQYFNYVADNDTVFQRQDMMTANGVWKAEWVEVPTAQDDEEDTTLKAFKLFNTAANKYVGTFGNSVMAPAVDAENAAVFKIVASNNGLAVQFVNAPITNDLYLSAYANDALLTLTSWIDVNDVNSQFSFFAIGEMTQDESYAAFAGTTGTDAMGSTVYTSINAVEIMVPQGAALTGNGEVKFGLGTGDWDDNWRPIVDFKKTWTSDDLKAVTPVTREVTREVYDWNIYDYVTVTGTYDVYTLPLDETYTELDVEYIVKGDAGLFSASTEEGYKVSCPLAASEYLDTPATAAVLPVSPEAGMVEELTKIEIGGDEGWFVNPEAEGGLKLTYNGEVAKDVNDEDIDCPAEEIDVRYYYWDMETYTEGYVINVNFTAVGTYKLTISEGVFVNDDNNYNEAVDVEWTIDVKDGILEISNVTVNGQAIYDLQGRRVAKPAHGLYIVDGKKVKF